jgi:hypothetical protein
MSHSLAITAHESQFSDKQTFHRAPKQRRPVSTEVLSNWPFILWLQGPASSAWWFTFLSRELSTSWYEIIWNNAPPHIRKPPHIRRLSPTSINFGAINLYIYIERERERERSIPHGNSLHKEWQKSYFVDIMLIIKLDETHQIVTKSSGRKIIWKAIMCRENNRLPLPSKQIY